MQQATARRLHSLCIAVSLRSSDERSELVEGDIESVSARAEELAETVDDMLAVIRETLHTNGDRFTKTS